ncbi:hypothetical protein ASG36_20410 [Geodermatophilus sp. Leaf369]|uniref:hypothetical protein n=1 Tax=Geodermatophilus sp. Leaf369 TaxID=1736354 RepID=UPI0006FBFD66|nr:hypothetical protein [Geodermatophilus sp. Leaf369]KQS54802.1 hypothetical protein ASG36_20410 [Geodermatophilus sp. Leaf369]
MRRAERALLGLLAVVALLLGLAPPAAAATGDDAYAADRVVVVGVPGLVWSDLDPDRTPTLWALAEESSIGALSVRAARPTTCVLDGWATLGAGNRARWAAPEDPIPPVPLPTDETGAPLDGSTPVPEPGFLGRDAAQDTSLSYCGTQEQIGNIGLADPTAAVAAIAADPATDRFGAEPGALGDAVGCASVVSRAATVAVAAEGTAVDLREELPDTGTLSALLGACPLGLVGLDQLTDAGQPSADETDTGTEPLPRAGALLQIDQALATVQDALATLPGSTLLLVQGVSEVNDGRPQLHVSMASGPGFGTGWLTSASTGRAPFSQLIDTAPTVLRALGLPEPASMNGQAVRAEGDRPALAEATQLLDQANTRAVVHYRSTGDVFWLLVLVSAAVVGLGMLTLGGGRSPGFTPVRLRRWWSRHRPSLATRNRLRHWVRPVCLVAASLPVGTYLGNVAPWHLADSPRLALAGLIALATVLVAGLAWAGPWRRRRLGPPVVVLGVTVATLALDVLTGSHLELDGMLGYDAIVAGRFTGYGNLTFGLMPVAALLLTAGAAAWVARRGAGEGRRRALVTVLVVGVVTVGLVGAPSLGRDFGGVLAAVPGFLLLAMLLGGIRVTVVRLVAVLAAAVVVVGSVAVLDWTRPPSERSHLGRFVAQVLDGQAWTVVTRKAEANLGILLGSPLAYTLLVAAVAAFWLLRPGGLLRSRPERGPDASPGGLPAADVRVLRAGLLSVALSLTVAAAVNDSGVAVPATAATLLVPLLVWLAAAPRTVETGDAAPSADGGVGESDRVSVTARGATG